MGCCATRPGRRAFPGWRATWSSGWSPARWRRRRARRPTGRCARWPGDIGISPASVQRIWAAHGLQPHRVRTFKLSTDPAFATKLRDVVGLYVDPPAHAVVLSVDEKVADPGA